jgi:glycosidase
VRDVNDAAPNWAVVEYILGLADFWLGEMDVDGFRLDVPNEVPYWFCEMFRRRVKSVKPDAFLVGEIWHGAADWVNRLLL